MNAEFTGRASLWMDYEYAGSRLLVAFVCDIDTYPPIHALLDTAAEWCILPPSIAEELGYDLTPDPQAPALHSRFGIHRGRLERIGIRFTAEEGEQLELEATFFLPADWPGQFVVIGWKGCLERLRFALDPARESFYFAESG